MILALISSSFGVPNYDDGEILASRLFVLHWSRCELLLVTPAKDCLFLIPGQVARARGIRTFGFARPDRLPR